MEEINSILIEYSIEKERNIEDWNEKLWNEKLWNLEGEFCILTLLML